MKQTDRLALLDWEKYKEDIARATPVDRNMTAAEREKHREYLEKHPIEWIKFFFPNYAKYEFADFQKKAILRIIAHDEHGDGGFGQLTAPRKHLKPFVVCNDPPDSLFLEAGKYG